MAAVAMVVLASVAQFLVAPYNQAFLTPVRRIGALEFTGHQFLLCVGTGYLSLVLAFVWLAPAGAAQGKSLLCLRALWGTLRRWCGHSPLRAWTHDERVAVLATLLKIYFAPMMVVSLMLFTVAALHNGAALLSDTTVGPGFASAFNRYGFWFAMHVILFVDVLLFTLGYVVETPALGNQIRSVEPTLLGWAVALLCYPPFNQITAAILGSQVSDFPQFNDPTAHLALNLLLLALMAVYAWATVALGLKASNLTHRGIVGRGPYAFIRHPAYVCKNMAWWIAAIPLVYAAFAVSWFEGALALASVLGWSMLYVLRALTEEDHLRGVDGEYAAYAARVRWRFIPGVY
jgi:protein-S-isoprenylcysteine O-methyltransferase Ste14